MAKPEKSGIRNRIMMGVISGLGVALATQMALGATRILYDFEDGPQGWENEAENPVPATIVETQARSGKRSVGFTYHFGPQTRILHCRVKFDPPRDCSSADFRGFSAWVYIPVYAQGWELKMFVRSGDDWKWNAGEPLSHLLPGWHKIQIHRHEISDLSRIQDMGIQVILTSAASVTAQILFDQVEIMSYP